MLKKIEGIPYSPAKLKFTDIHQTLFEVDGPRVFTANTLEGLMLFLLVDEDNSSLRFLVAPTTLPIVEGLELNGGSIKGALMQPMLWIVETDLSYKVSDALLTTLSRIPNDYLPFEGARLDLKRSA